MSNAATPPALHVENLRIDRGGRTVIDNISLSVPAGIITGLLGPSEPKRSAPVRPPCSASPPVREVCVGASAM
jgi:ABC-type transporter Mla maintaining outer membrane lipid asymmetry ATPase subunit MlaF